MTKGARLGRGLVLPLLAASMLAAAPALAHHGWSWAEGDQTTLKGVIQDVSMAPPHPVLKVKAANGVVWRVDLGNPGQTQRSGFTGASAKPGDAVTVLGNRSLDKSQAHMKAVRITLGDRNYDMYPERITAN